MKNNDRLIQSPKDVVTFAAFGICTVQAAIGFYSLGKLTVEALADRRKTKKEATLTLVK